MKMADIASVIINARPGSTGGTDGWATNSDGAMPAIQPATASNRDRRPRPLARRELWQPAAKHTPLQVRQCAAFMARHQRNCI